MQSDNTLQYVYCVYRTGARKGRGMQARGGMDGLGGSGQVRRRMEYHTLLTSHTNRSSTSEN